MSDANDDWPGRRIDHAAFAAALAERRAALGEPEMQRNAGSNRTASKKTLLAAIKQTGKRW
ncbi:hypothetical protein SAMN05216382_0962 [Sphingomonas palmae]|uniref:Uncharacterized protein n=1 Tax=Sphingomonas palmae TaxID=1855283 RepID=A0A1H7JCB5_9SPHN|nr:hypothetical protein [Sphingomonas palmae]SEK70945.1 hypothetical protein SAMN05216382_0962 [Sphingomonas palmae]